MGAFDSTLKELSVRKNPGKCKYGIWLEELNPADYKELQEALESQKYSLKVIYKALRSLGVTVTYETFRTHLKGECKCSKNL